MLAKKISMLGIVLLTLMPCTGARAIEIGLNLYGLSYHFNRLAAKYVNETNPGLGANVVMFHNRWHVLFTEGGFYRDSGENTAKYMSVGYQFMPLSFIGVGINLVRFNSPTLNWGRTFVAPVPLLSLRYSALAVHVAYLGKWGDLNPFPSLGGYLTFYLFQSGASQHKRPSH